MSTSLDSDLRFLENHSPFCPSGYHGVYEHGSGKWQAKAMRKQVGELQATPRAAAIVLIEWWRHWFGEHWKEFYAARKTPGYQFIPDGNNWRVLLFLLGKPQYLGRGQRGTAFPTKEAACAAFAEWKRQRYGLYERYAGLELRRRARFNAGSENHHNSLRAS